MQHNQTKVSLSDFELELVSNAEILLTKNQIIEKVYTMFGELAERYAEALNGFFPANEPLTSAKISRGENYEGLPYVMLDFPRRFKKDDTFAIRTFFWWGNFFSINLQLVGTSYQQYIPNLIVATENNLLHDWYVSVNENMWQHHFREDNYRLIQSHEFQDLQGKNEIKVAKKIPLQEWDNSIYFLEENFRFLLSILKS